MHQPDNDLIFDSTEYIEDLNTLLVSFADHIHNWCVEHGATELSVSLIEHINTMMEQNIEVTAEILTYLKYLDRPSLYVVK